MAARLRDINPQINLTVLTDFLYPDQAANLVQTGQFDFVIDCIDSIACKAALVAACLQQSVAVASSLGAGNRLDVTQVRVSQLNQTKICPLARELRASLRKMGVPTNYPVVYSEELPCPPLPHQPVTGPSGRPRAVNGTISYLPALFGMMLAGLVIQRLLNG
jgi:tRNA A37 threonylcarbamoyladenosine dehydratase